MPELVWNPLMSRYVAVAPGRSTRPGAVPSPTGRLTKSREEIAPRPSFDPDCPLCETNEAMTPPEVWADRPDGSAPDSPGWLVRSVPNLYPAVEGPGRSQEVLVHSPDHSCEFPDMEAGARSRLVSAWLARIESLFSVDSTNFVQVSVNRGRNAGASLAHPHSQIVALDFTPPVAWIETDATDDPDRCPLCRAETSGLRGEFEVGEMAGIRSACPPWSEFAHEVLVYPVDHRSVPSNATALPVAELVGSALTALREIAGDPAYNLVLHVGNPDDDRGFHWHLHVWPRIATPAALEFGAGLPVTVTSPRDSAAAYRSSS